MTSSNFFLSIDKSGNILKDSQVIDKKDFINEVLSNIYIDDLRRVLSKVKNKDVLVEAYDEPLILQSIKATDTYTWEAQAQSEFKLTFELEKLTLDEWDRFHGHSSNGAPFVLSDHAQDDFFNQLDSFDDDSITYHNKTIQISDWIGRDPERDVDAKDFWTNTYQTQGQPKWELLEPSKALVDTLNQIKLNKCRVAVLGCGSGNDAAHFAKLGHKVTAFDFSEEAIKRAKEKYGNQENLEFVQMDVFDLAKKYKDSFDLVFEHTCYCAVDPKRRNELTKVWRDLLVDKGHFLGVMFTLNKPDGPPFGGSEWEINKRLEKYFNFRYWTRWRHSIESRMGFEIVVYGEKKTF